ncbi:MAG: hypothetical protein AB3N14_19965 [Flavobacteriaceae bacterium]
MKIPELDPVKTILTITVGLLILYFITKLEVFVYASTAIGVLGLISSFVAKKITLIWGWLSWLLSLIVPNILLSFIFYFILFPIALLSRIFGNRDPLQLKDKEQSMFKRRDATFDSASFEKLW